MANQLTDIERLTLLDSCTVADALDTLELTGVAEGLRPLTTSTKLVGRVVTVQLGDAGAATSKSHLGAEAVDASREGDVIVVGNRGRLDVGAWGGLLSLAAAQRGVRGVIIDGACRDIDEADDLGLAVFGRGAIPSTARGRVVQIGWNVPIRIGTIEMNPGDLVIADRSGVVVIPAGLARSIIERAEEIQQVEGRLANEIRSGRSTVEVMNSRYEALLNARREA